MNLSYRCVSCGNTFNSDQIHYLCRTCGSSNASGFQKGVLIVENEPTKACRKNAAIDPLSFLPLPVPAITSFPAGNTPLVVPSRSQLRLGLPGLSIKNECTNPSGSLKDRASLLVAGQAIHHKQRRIVLASTGNAGSAMACVGAACGLDVILLVPSSAPKAKIIQSLMYGAKVIPVQGTYDDAFKLSIDYSLTYGGINRNTAYNPLTVEGKKTAALELYNQLQFRVPDIIYIPAGDGVIFAGLCKGFLDLLRADLIRELPRCVMVQAAGSSAIVQSWSEGRDVILDKADTIADSLAVASPANGEMSLQYLKRTKGWGITVSDAEILAAQKTLASEAGLFVEPSAATAWAGLEKDRRQKATDQYYADATIVVLLTGIGFKDMAAAEHLVHLPRSCPPDIDAVHDYLHGTYKLIY